jgi:hypothetical protein
MQTPNPNYMASRRLADTIDLLKERDRHSDHMRKERLRELGHLSKEAAQAYSNDEVVKSMGRPKSVL